MFINKKLVVALVAVELAVFVLGYNAVQKANYVKGCKESVYAVISGPYVESLYNKNCEIIYNSSERIERIMSNNKVSE